MIDSISDSDIDLIAKTMGWQTQRFGEVGAFHVTCDDEHVFCWHPDEYRDDWEPIFKWLGKPENRGVLYAFVWRLRWIVLEGEEYRGITTDTEFAMLRATPAQMCTAFLEAIR